MLHRSESHFNANVFAKGNQSDTNDSSDLMGGLLLIFFVFCTQMEHLLDFEDIS